MISKSRLFQVFFNGTAFSQESAKYINRQKLTFSGQIGFEFASFVIKKETFINIGKFKEK